MPWLILVFWFFIRILIGIISLFVWVIVFNLVQNYHNLFDLFDHSGIYISGWTVEILALVSFTIEMRIFFVGWSICNWLVLTWVIWCLVFIATTISANIIKSFFSLWVILALGLLAFNLSMTLKAVRISFSK